MLPEEKQQQTHDFEGSEEGVRIDTIDSEDDDFQYQFNFDLSVAIIEEETDEVESEFFDSVKEIEGSKSFACTHCEKICKSKGGLTRRINSKHKEARDIDTSAEHNQIPLCEGTITSIIQSIKTDLLEKKYYGEEIQNGLKNVSGGEALLDALQPLYEKFCRKKNMDKLLESFYGLIPRSCELLNCNDYRVANLSWSRYQIIWLVITKSTALKRRLKAFLLQLAVKKESTLRNVAPFRIWPDM